MVPVSYHDFFGGCATVAGALIGLLFVAISVSPEKLTGDRAVVDHQVKAGAAFSALVNTLLISLVALLPSGGIADTVTIVAAVGLSSTVGLIIIGYRERQDRMRPRQILMLLVLLVMYGLQLANGIRLEGSPSNAGLINDEGVLAIVFFVFAIERAWQLVGARETGLLAVVGGMAHRPARSAAYIEARDNDKEISVTDTLVKELYTAEATVTGGRAGHARSSDGLLEVDLRVPESMGGPGGGTNPEQLFAAGYAACFQSALATVGRRQKVDTSSSTVTARVSIGTIGGGGYGLAVTLAVSIPEVDKDRARQLVEAAHQVCPYSNATRGNIDVQLIIE
jgi:Ohr subfamily peroxiredoxin